MNKAYHQLTNHLEVLRQEEMEIHNRRIQLQNEIEKIRKLIT
ncbi:hypothetical protein [Bacillus sp. Bva_UNVM-123]